MKPVMGRIALLAGLLVMFSGTAHAWNCTTPGQIRVQVPNGTLGSGQGDGNGQVDTVEGITFECEAPPTAPTTPTTTSNSASNSNSSAGSISGATSTSKATGGTATASQTQNQTATSSANNNGNGSNNSTYQTNTTVEAPKIPVDTAYAPTSLPTVTCFKPITGGAQTVPFGISLGGGSIDSGCDAREFARQFALMGSRLAACKMLVTQKRTKEAGVTLADCMTFERPIITPAPIAPSPVAPNITVNVPSFSIPAPIVTVLPPPIIAPPVPLATTAKKVVRKKHVVICPCQTVTNDSLQLKPKGS